MILDRIYVCISKIKSTLEFLLKEMQINLRLHKVIEGLLVLEKKMADKGGDKWNFDDSWKLEAETVGEISFVQEGLAGLDNVRVGELGLFTQKGNRISLVKKADFKRISVRLVHTKILASTGKFVKASGLIAIPPKLRAGIHLHSAEGLAFNQKFAGSPIKSGDDLANRISDSISASSAYTNMALNQHLVVSLLANTKFDKSFINSVMPEVDYTGYKDGVTPLQFLEARTLKVTLGHLLERTSNSFSITAVNPDAPTAQQLVQAKQCYAVMKQRYNDFTFSFKVLIDDRHTTIERFFDVKVSMRSPVECLAYTKGFLSVCSEFPIVHYNKNYAGQIGSTLSQKEFDNLAEPSAIKDWKIKVKQISDIEKDAQICFMKIRNINDSVLLDPQISSMIPCYFNKTPLDGEFKFIGEDPALLRNIELVIKENSYNIDKIIPTEQVIDVEATDAFVKVIAYTLKPSLAQEIINNYFHVKALSFI